MKRKKEFDEEWIEIGINSFARFFDLTEEDVYIMMENANRD